MTAARHSVLIVLAMLSLAAPVQAAPPEVNDKAGASELLIVDATGREIKVKSW